LGLDAANKAIPDTDLLGNEVAANNSIKGPINILLVGLDTRPDNTIGSRSDSIIIVHIPASHDSAYLVSIPRDTNAYIPPDKATKFAGGDWKINAAFEYGSRDKGGPAGGFQLLAATIKQDYGITFNGGGIVDFSGFTNIVTKLGGVDMTVDETTVSIHHGFLTSDPSKKAAPFKINPSTGAPRCPGKVVFNSVNYMKCALPGVTPVVYHKGPQHLTPYEALDFVRQRDGLPYTDYDRQRHQQQFIKAVMTEMESKGLTNPTKMLGFLDSLGKAITFSRGGVSLSDWIFTLKGITPSSMITFKTNGGKYVSYTGPAPDDRQALSPDSQTLLKDVVDDNLGQFVAEHPDWVAAS
jgi:LCP family protein required for cell wall assembly